MLEPVAGWVEQGLLWVRGFRVEDAGDPLSDEELERQLEHLQAPFSEAELQEIGAAGIAAPPISLTRPAPPSWLDFLRRHNGGDFSVGERTFTPMFSVAEAREYLCAYSVPRRLPGAQPFAMDGGACFYHFDMREPPVRGEYPIVLTEAWPDSWEDAFPLAKTFGQALRDRRWAWDAAED